MSVSKEKIKLETLFITQPLPSNNKYHVFYEDQRSLCGRYMILMKNPDFCEPVTWREKFIKGSDCKSCFDKLKKIPKLKLLIW